MEFLTLGGGWYYTIIPPVFSPGIYLDGGIGLDWARLFSKEKGDIEKDHHWQLGFTFSGRIYNHIELNMVSIMPFAGYAFIAGQLDPRLPFTTGRLLAGALIAVDFIGLEYAYYIPAENETTFHHISLMIHLNEKMLK